MGLVLTRKENQAIVIRGPSVVRVVRVSGGRVQLHVEADRSTQVDREEVAKRKERREAKS